jgi:hypothetical protein
MQFKYTVTPSAEKLRGCKPCKRNLPEAAFDASGKYCRECQSARAKNRTQEQRRGYYLKATYSITTTDYNALLDKQNNSCAICGQPGGKLRTGSGLHVDHCHETGAVRGLLCFNCNTALGKFSDNIERLQSAINYLNSHESS